MIQARNQTWNEMYLQITGEKTPFSLKCLSLISKQDGIDHKKELTNHIEVSFVVVMKDVALQMPRKMVFTITL